MKKRMFKILALILSAALLVTGTFYFTLAYLQAKSEAVVNTFTAGKINLTLKESEVDQYGNIKYYVAGSFIEGSINDDDVKYSKVTGTTENVGGADVTYDTVNYVQGNEYKLVPGQTYTKDPVVTVAEGSEECYLYLAVYDGLHDYYCQLNEIDGTYEATDDGSYKTIKDQLNENGWEVLFKLNNDGTDVDTTKRAELINTGYNNTDNQPPRWYEDYFPSASEGSVTIYYYAGKDANKTYLPQKDTAIPTFNEFKLGTDADEDDVLILEYASIISLALAVQTVGFKDDENTEGGAHKPLTVAKAWEATFGKSAANQ